MTKRGAETTGDTPEPCPTPHLHGNPFRFCPNCEWREAPETPHEVRPKDPDPNRLCIHPFNRITALDCVTTKHMTDREVGMVHKNWLVHIVGWCPDCGSLITADGRKITPGHGLGFDLVDGMQVFLEGEQDGVRKGTA